MLRMHPVLTIEVIISTSYTENNQSTILFKSLSV
jgi:hypothetical protein